jgi:hypothetical protein
LRLQKTLITASFLTEAPALERHAPVDFQLAGEPVVTIEFHYINHIVWLGSRIHDDPTLVARSGPLETSGRRGSIPASSQVVRIVGLHARPLGGGTSIDSEILLAYKPLWPAGRRVLPLLLPPVYGQVE